MLIAKSNIYIYLKFRRRYSNFRNDKFSISESILLLAVGLDVGFILSANLCDFRRPASGEDSELRQGDGDL